MKRKFLINLVVGVVITLLASSCFLTGEQSKDNVQTYEEEMLLLGEYLDSLVARGYDIDTTELGVYYITIDEGEGDYPQSGDKLEVIYSGYLMNGYMFDSSELSTSTGSW